MSQPSVYRLHHWAGPALLAAGVCYVLTLGTLRDRLAGVPDVVWFAVLIALLSAGGALTARGLAPYDVATLAAADRRAPATRLARRRLTARGAVLIGSAGLSYGVISATSRAAGWTDGARATGALAFGAALALLPFGVVLLRRTARDARAAAVRERDRQAWQAAERGGS